MNTPRPLSRFNMIFRIVSLVLILTFSTSSLGTAVSSAPQEMAPSETNFEVVKLPPGAEILPASLHTPVEASRPTRLDTSMAEIAQSAQVSTQAALETANRYSVRVSGTRVQAHINTDPAGVAAARQAIASSGGEVTGVAFEDTLIQAWLPVTTIDRLLESESIFYIQRPVPGTALEIDAISEGLAVINGNAWHAAGITGTGVKIGVIDGGYEGYTALVGSDLPSNITVKNFVDGEDDLQVDGTSKHGTACAEIVHDIAPGAAMYLAKISTTVDLEEAANWLKNTHQVDVVSVSFGWRTETPGDGTGYLADLAQSMRNAGILWVQAAGNERDTHWGGTYRDTNQNNFHEFNTSGQEVNYFGPGDGNAYNIPSGYYIPVQIRWNDWTNVNQDYDLHVVRWNGSSWQIIASSTNPQTGGGGQRPTEYAVGLSTGGDTPYGYIIERKNSTQTVNFEAYAIKVAPTDEVLHSRSIISMADAPAAFTVAALDVNSPYDQESYSSEGPTNGPGGSENGGFTKPDISGYANVTTVSYGSGGFNGTSSATPHVAGAAALVYSAYPGYTPDQVQSFLEGRAIDKGAAGMDNLFGYGRLYLSDPPGPAADKVWNGNVSSDWHNANNWTPAGVPTSGQTVLIPDTARDPIVSSANAAAKDLTLDPGAALDLTTRTITIEGTVTNNGTLTQSKNVSVGSTTEFLRIKNQAGTQTKYYGVDISPGNISESTGDRDRVENNEPSFLERLIGTVSAWFSGLFSPAGKQVAVEPETDNQVPETEPVTKENDPDTGYHPGLVRPDINTSAEMVNLVLDDEPQPAPPSSGIRGVELRLESDLLVVPTSAGQFTPEEPQASVSLVVDDGSIESGFGVNSETNSYQFIWLNRFTPSPSEYPFTLNEIRVMFADNGGTWGVSIGDEIDLVVYEDADGNPANGATWRATFNTTIQAVNGTTWSVYSLSSPVTLNGPGDVLIGVIDRFVDSGVTGKTYPATFDTTSSQERSWIGWWNVDPPEPPTLPPNDTFDLMTGGNAGNWLIRGYGETSSLEGIHGTVTYNGSPAEGIYLILRYYNGSAWSTWGSPVATDSNGEYLFSGMPDLGSGQVYYVRYENGANGNLDVTNYLSAWYSFQIPSYTSGMYINGGDFDIADIKSASPSPGATVTLPQAFTWTRRSATTDDSYSFNLYDPVDGDPEFESSMLGYVDQYTLSSLPPNFDYDTQYAWYVRVYAPDDGYGYPYYARYITFTDGGQPTVTPTPTTTSTSTSTPTATTTTTVQPPTVTPTPTATLTPIPGDADMTVSISGNQHCTGRISGVDRCYDIESQKSITATVRFYFTEAERIGISKSDLFAFHYQDGWEKQAGPYTTGGSGDGQYVQVQNLNQFSPYALDRETGGPYLPMTMKFAGAPPVPQLYDIQNPDGNGDYTVSWSGVSGANSYVLEEDDNNSFSSPTTVYDGNGTSKNITGKMIGTYYYRVKAVNDYKSSGWSQVKSVNVSVEPPQVCEQHDFGDSGVQYYIYSSGKTWNFTAQNTMTIESVETKSVLATARGLTFTIRVKINDVTIASWSQYVNNTSFQAYYHSANVTYQLNQGDKVTYFISAPAGSGEAAIAWYNYVKLCGR